VLEDYLKGVITSAGCQKRRKNVDVMVSAAAAIEAEDAEPEPSAASHGHIAQHGLLPQPRYCTLPNLVGPHSAWNSVGCS